MLTRFSTSVLLIIIGACLSLIAKAQNDCKCLDLLELDGDENCLYILTKEKLGLKNCPDSYVIVDDSKPENRDTIEATGVYNYILYAKDGQVICKGLVVAKDNPVIVLDSVDFIKDTLPYGDLNYYLDFKTMGATNTFASPKDYQIILGPDGKYQSWVFQNGKFQGIDFETDTVPNLGLPFFRRKCLPENCQVILSMVPDRIYPTCEEVRRNNLYVTLTRKWTARDCNNNVLTWAVQNIPIRRPERKDFHWNVPTLKAREASFKYGNCTLDAKNVPIDALFPVVGKTNELIGESNGPVLNMNKIIKNQIDTICSGAGLSYQRKYLIYDDCQQKNIDTFTITLSPGNNTADWLNVGTGKKFIYLTKDSCGTIFHQQLDSILKVLGLKLNPVCPVQYINWKLERYSDQYFQLFFREYWDEIKSNKIGYGNYRIHFTMIDECQNLCTKTVEFVVKSKEELKITCIEPFRAALVNNYFIASYRFARPDPIRQSCGSINYVRRIVPKECLAPHLYANYDLDRDFNIIEHFELIKSGPYAGQYYTPWSGYVEAFACDRGKTVYFESKVMTFDGRETICTSYFYVGDQNPYQAQMEVGKAQTSATRQVRIPITVNPFLSMIGIQFGVRFDPNLLKLDSVHVPNSGLKKMAFGYPGQGANPQGRVLLSWSFDGSSTVSLPGDAPLVELCFSPLKTGTSKVWIDTTFATELIDFNQIPYTVRTTVGEVQVLTKNEIGNRVQQSLTTPLLAIDNAVKPDTAIRIFPNPGSDKVNIALPESWPPQGIIVLRDVQGRQLLKKNIEASTTSIDTHEIPTGLVFVEIQRGTQVWMERLVIVRPD